MTRSADRTEIRMEGLLAIIDSDSSSDGEKENAQRMLQILQRKSSVGVEELRMRSRKKEKVAPELRSFEVGEKGNRASGAFSLLFNAIATPNDVRCLMSNSHIEAIGMAADLDYSMALYERLVVQMVLSCNEYIKSGEWRGRESRVSAARKAFYLGYTDAVMARLREANRIADSEIQRDTGTSSAVALRDKKGRVDETFSAHRGTRRRPYFTDAWKENRTPSVHKGRDEGNRVRMFDSAEIKGTRGAIES